MDEQACRRGEKPNAHQQTRAAAQGLLTFATLGLGLFIGAWISGRVVEANSVRDAAGLVTHDWHTIWLIPAGLAAGILLLFAVLFRPSVAVRSPGLAGASLS